MYQNRKQGAEIVLHCNILRIRDNLASILTTLGVKVRQMIRSHVLLLFSPETDSLYVLCTVGAYYIDFIGKHDEV